MYNFLWDQTSFLILKLIQMCQINEEIPSSLPEYKVAVVDFIDEGADPKGGGHQPIILENFPQKLYENERK